VPERSVDPVRLHGLAPGFLNRRLDVHEHSRPLFIAPSTHRLTAKW
jgi:hypothetical protein